MACMHTRAVCLRAYICVCRCVRNFVCVCDEHIGCNNMLAARAIPLNLNVLCVCSNVCVCVPVCVCVCLCTCAASALERVIPRIVRAQNPDQVIIKSRELLTSLVTEGSLPGERIKGAYRPMFKPPYGVSMVTASIFLHKHSEASILLETPSEVHA